MSAKMELKMPDLNALTIKQVVDTAAYLPSLKKGEINAY
jgi:hypothetical protein